MEEAQKSDSIFKAGNIIKEEEIVQENLRYTQVSLQFNEDADFLYLCTLYDGVTALITELQKRNIMLAVLSNKPQSTTEKVVESFFGKNTFTAVFGQREGIPIKPDPAGVFEILALLGCEKSECLYIGDTAVDINTGKAAGLSTVGVLWGFRNREELQGAGATVIIEKPEECTEKRDGIPPLPQP